MTETLKQLMDHDAHRADFAPLDLAALVADGARRVRRRRLALASTGFAAAAAVALVLPLALGGSTPDHTRLTPAGPAPVPPVSWATDSVIHLGDTSVQTGHQVDTYVQTTDGFGFVSDGRVFSVLGSDVKSLGRIVAPTQPRLVADGSRIGWQSPDGFSIYDQSTDLEKGFQGAAGPGPTFYALDGTTAYWLDATGAVVAFDVETKQKQVVEADPPPGYEILDAKHGVQAVTTDQGVVVGSDLEHGRQLDGYADHGELSPDAAYFAIDADSADVYDVSTGQRVSFDLSQYAFSSAVTWLDDQHVVVLASTTRSGPASLLTCTVPTGSCSVSVGDLGTFKELVGHFQLPVGLPITG